MAAKKNKQLTSDERRHLVTRDFEDHVTATLRAQDDVLEKLDKRMSNAHVMNGGFDTVVEKLEKIESVQTELKGAASNLAAHQETQGKKLDEVHTAIYDPEIGLYAKVKGALGWIHNANWILKGFIGVVGTGAVGGIAKLAYDLVTGHLLIHYAH